MENPKDPKNPISGEEKVTNNSDKVVNKKTENLHEVTNEEQWVHDVNEEFGDDFILPDQDDDQVVN